MKNVLVTGGSRGIGAAISLRLKREGYFVIASYNSNHHKAEDFSKTHGIPTYSFNVANARDCEKNIAKIIADHGNIDALIHNAGITKDGFFHKMPLENWVDVMETNLMSCFYVTKPLIEHMRNRNYGRLIYLSSVNAIKGQAGQTNYTAAKAGIIGFVRSLALENANKGITVNAVAPGYTDTDMVGAIGESILSKIIEMIPSKRLGRPEEIAETINFLMSDGASYITGTTININGGMVF